MWILDKNHYVTAHYTTDKIYDDRIILIVVH